jgi:hypothetical protein
MQSISENDFERLASTGVKTPQSAITEGPLTWFPAQGNHRRDMTQDSDKPKPQASKGSDVHKAAREYLKMLRSLNPNYDVKAAVSVQVMKRPS